jgi:hypothetical protein
MLPDEPITIDLHKSLDNRLPYGSVILKTIPRYEWITTPSEQRRRKREILIEFKLNEEIMTMVVPRRLHKWRVK